MRSMTGFGRGRCEVAGRRLVIEVRTVNHRFLDLKLRLPWADPVVEQQLTQAIRKRLERGAVTAAVRDEGGGESAPEVVANLPLARAYAKALEAVRDGVGLVTPVPLELIVQQPGVLLVGGALVDSEALWGALAPGVTQALDDLLASRRREGASLVDELRQRALTLRGLAAEIAALAIDTPGELKRRLEERLARLSDVALDPQRLAQEVAILADRADVAEELSRLKTHLDELDRLLADPDAAVGRRLDFLAQELNREVNTVGSKSPRAEIAQRVISAKVEIERLREQVQNAE